MQETILELKGINKSFKNNKILQDVSFEIKRGDIIGYLGPNGAGKTTTIRLILGLIKPDSGEIVNNAKVLRAVLDKEGLYDQLTPLQHLNYLFLHYYGRKATTEEAKQLLKQIGLDSSVNKKVHEFSKGMKKRLSIACSLVGEPDLLILDEPFTGLDPQGQKSIEDLLTSLSPKTTILLSSHNIAIVSKICNRALMLNKEITYDDYIKNISFPQLEKIYFAKTEEIKNDECV